MRAWGAAIFLAPLAACEDRSEFVYPAPDARAAVFVQPAGARWPRAGQPNVVRLVDWSRTASEGGGLSHAVVVGTFSGPWNPAAIAWTSADTVNICPMGGDRAFRVRFPNADKTRNSYRVTTNCRFEPAARPVMPAG